MPIAPLFRSALLFVAAVLGALAAPRDSTSQPAPCGIDALDRRQHPHRVRAGIQSDCPLQGACDDPASRDTTSVDWRPLRAIVHVMRRSDGSGGVTSGAVDSMIAQINADLRAGRSGFHLDLVATRFHDDDTFACLPGCGPTGCESFFSMMQYMKSVYAERPEDHLNVYIACMPVTPYGYFSGVGFFPWWPGATDWDGGFWLNVQGGMPPGAPHIAVHELGHVLGLYHTFHGVSEVECSDPCVEYASGFESDLRGDFASDTPATPRNFSCAPPGGADCLGTPYGATAIDNFMEYTPQTCQTRFSPQQTRRMQCWTKAVLGRWSSAPPGPCERPLDAATRTLWHLSEGQGTATADAAGAGLTGDVVGGATWSVTACGSSALTFDAPNHGLRLPASAVGTLPAGTLECTVQWSGSDPGAEGAWIADQSLGPGASNLGLVLRPDGRLELHLAGAVRVISSRVLVPLRWTRIAGTWDGGSASLRLDDVTDAVSITSAAPESLDAPLWCGRSGGTAASAGAFAGAIDEIRVSRLARTAGVPPATAPGRTLDLRAVPHPSRGTAEFAVHVPRAGHARVRVYDLSGRRLATLHDGPLHAGDHRVRWPDGALARLAPGAYVVRLDVGEETARRTWVWLR